jgi:hypothetical protein
MSTRRRHIPRQLKPELGHDICPDVGFNDVSNFNRRFLEPRKFRRGVDSPFGGRH